MADVAFTAALTGCGAPGCRHRAAGQHAARPGPDRAGETIRALLRACPYLG
jgi:hypothetical protein